MNTPARSRIPADVAALIRKGVSVIVGSADSQLRPSIMRAVGSDIAPDDSLVTVYLGRMQARQLLQDITAGGRISVVFSQPSTHRAVQLKATRAQTRNATADDEPVLQRYLASMEVEIATIGFPPEVTRTMLWHRLDDVVAVSFRPEQAYEQTPGPRAGTVLELLP